MSYHMKFYLRVVFSLYFWASAGAAAAAANDELPAGRAGPACSGSRSRIGAVATDDRRPAVSALSKILTDKVATRVT